MANSSIDPRYPIGAASRAEAVDAAQILHTLPGLRRLPENLRSAVDGLDDAQLDTPYREGGWTVRQVVHHVADSHMQAYVRMRLALTEDWPIITPYNEKLWAELADCADASGGGFAGDSGSAAPAVDGAAEVADRRGLGARDIRIRSGAATTLLAGGGDCMSGTRGTMWPTSWSYERVRGW